MQHVLLFLETTLKTSTRLASHALRQPLVPLALCRLPLNPSSRGGVLLVATGTMMVWIASTTPESTPREPCPVPSQAAVPLSALTVRRMPLRLRVTVTLVPVSASNPRGLPLTLGISALSSDGVSSRMGIPPRTMKATSLLSKTSRKPQTPERTSTRAPLQSRQTIVGRAHQESPQGQPHSQFFPTYEGGEHIERSKPHS
jgi:hypothetical protein